MCVRRCVCERDKERKALAREYLIVAIGSLNLGLMNFHFI